MNNLADIKHQHNIVDVIGQYLPLKSQGIITLRVALFTVRKRHHLQSMRISNFITVSDVARMVM